MNTLIIDCSAGMSVYVLVGKEVYSSVDDDKKKHSDELLLIIDELLNGANVNIKNIDNICVCVGPGSFTGIRVALSVCKGLAIGSSASVFVAKNFDIFENVESNDSLIILEGFARFLYVRKHKDGNVFEECILIDDLIQDIKNNKYNIYVQNKKVQNLLNNYEIASKIAQNNIISYFDKLISNNERIDINKISPVYLRASQAEMERNLKVGKVNAK